MIRITIITIIYILLVLLLFSIKNNVFTELNSKNKSLLIINLADEGWLSTDEFVDAFTDLHGTSVLLSVLNLINQVVPFKIINRTSHPALMAELDL